MFHLPAPMSLYVRFLYVPVSWSIISHLFCVLISGFMSLSIVSSLQIPVLWVPVHCISSFLSPCPLYPPCLCILSIVVVPFMFSSFMFLFLIMPLIVSLPFLSPYLSTSAFMSTSFLSHLLRVHVPYVLSLCFPGPLCLIA